MEVAKIIISDKELDLIQDMDVLELKKSALKKIGEMMKSLLNQLEIIDLNFLDQNKIRSKISKGENYRGFPFMVLDYPGIFEKKDIFTFRTIFLWGRYFNFTLFLSGRHLEMHRGNLTLNIGNLENKGYFIKKLGDPFNYIVGKPEYQPISSNEQIEGNYLIISRLLELKDWRKFEKEGRETFKDYMSLIAEGLRDERSEGY